MRCASPKASSSYAKLAVSLSVSTEFISLKDLPQNAAIMFAAACSF